MQGQEKPCAFCLLSFCAEHFLLRTHQSLTWCAKWNPKLFGFYPLSPSGKEPIEGISKEEILLKKTLERWLHKPSVQHRAFSVPAPRFWNKMYAVSLTLILFKSKLKTLFIQNGFYLAGLWNFTPVFYLPFISMYCSSVSFSNLLESALGSVDWLMSIDHI